MSKPIYRWRIEYTDGFVRTITRVITKKELSIELDIIFNTGGQIVSLERFEV